MRELTGLQRDLLVVLGCLETPCGLDVKRELEHSQERSLLASCVYSNLDELVSAGLVEKGCTDGRTNAYSLTATGVDALRARYRWRESYLPVADVLSEDRDHRADGRRRFASEGLG